MRTDSKHTFEVESFDDGEVDALDDGEVDAFDDDEVDALDDGLRGNADEADACTETT